MSAFAPLLGQSGHCQGAEFVWLEPGSRHVAVAPEGGLMLAMFQIPNKFYERDGRVTDANGEDWETVWGRMYRERRNGLTPRTRSTPSPVYTRTGRPEFGCKRGRGH